MKKYFFLILMLTINPSFAQYYNGDDSSLQITSTYTEQNLVKKFEPYQQIISFTHKKPYNSLDEEPFPTNPIYAYEYLGTVKTKYGIMYKWQDNTKLNVGGKVRTIISKNPTLPRCGCKTYKNYQQWMNEKFHNESHLVKKYRETIQNLEIADFTNINPLTGQAHRQAIFPLYSYVYYGTFVDGYIKKYAWLMARIGMDGKPFYKLIYTNTPTIPKHTGGPTYKSLYDWNLKTYGNRR